MRNKCVANHMLLRNETYYFLKRVPYDLKDYYSVKRLCFSLKTKSYSSALRMTKSVLQRLEDIKYIQSLSKKEDDELRWLLLLLSDSGMRLSEALGLSKDDINLNNPIS